jgi:hypothetical protein
MNIALQNLNKQTLENKSMCFFYNFCYVVDFVHISLNACKLRNQGLKSGEQKSQSVSISHRKFPSSHKQANKTHISVSVCIIHPGAFDVGKVQNLSSHRNLYLRPCAHTPCLAECAFIKKRCENKIHAEKSRT